jgi:RecA/RadA recombinase
MSKKMKALDLAMAQIEKQFGAGAVMVLGGKPPAENIQSIPTGSLSLDIALGIGGIP